MSVDIDGTTYTGRPLELWEARSASQPKCSFPADPADSLRHLAVGWWGCVFLH